MDKFEARALCRKKETELIKKYFPDISSGTENEETRYPADLPFRAQKEFYDFLDDLWQKIYPDRHDSFVSIMDRFSEIPALDAEYVPKILEAQKDAELITLWERTFRTNHKDVEEYHKLLKDYTINLLEIMTRDFSEDIL